MAKFKLEILADTAAELADGVRDLQGVMGGMVAGELMTLNESGPFTTPEGVPTVHVDITPSAGVYTPPITTDDSGELDADGTAWDERIHASTKAKNADGRWRLRKGVDKELVKQVLATEPEVPAAPPVVPTPPEVTAPVPVVVAEQPVAPPVVPVAAAAPAAPEVPTPPPVPVAPPVAAAPVATVSPATLTTKVLEALKSLPTPPAPAPVVTSLLGKFGVGNIMQIPAERHAEYAAVCQAIVKDPGNWELILAGAM